MLSLLVFFLFVFCVCVCVLFEGTCFSVVEEVEASVSFVLTPKLRPRHWPGFQVWWKLNCLIGGLGIWTTLRAANPNHQLEGS